jgi:hypothetical protein
MFQNHSFAYALFFAQLLQNHKVSFVPGWDCHGLPIELKGEFIYTIIYGNAQVSIVSYGYDYILDWWINFYKPTNLCVYTRLTRMIANYFMQF